MNQAWSLLEKRMCRSLAVDCVEGIMMFEPFKIKSVELKNRVFWIAVGRAVGNAEIPS
jgi:hypothetical protein